MIELLLLLAAIGFDTASTATCTVCSSVNVPAHVVGGGCTSPILVVGTSWESGGGVTLTSVASVGTGGGTLTSRGSTTDGDGNHSVNLSSLPGPTGSQSVTATFSASMNNAAIVVSSYCGVDQTTPHGTVATASSNDTPVTVDVTSAAGDFVVDMIFSHASVTVVSGQNQRANIPDDAFFVATSDEAGIAGTVTMSWDQSGGHYWGVVAIPIKPTAAPTTGPRRRPMILQ